MISSLELARICGVSQGTVDRALHDRPGVSAETKRLVLEAAERLGYMPHPAARELMGGAKSAVLGALVPSLNAIFFMDLMQALREACDRRGLRLFITPVSEKTDFLDALSDFAARRVRGILAVPPEEDIEVPANIANSLPIATLLSPVKNTQARLFAPDERVTGETAVAYLWGLGHRHIAHITYERKALAIDQRAAGYELALQQRSIKGVRWTFESGNALLQRLREHETTALFCHNDALAVKVIMALRSSGMNVPGDVSVIGVDNSPTLRQFQTELTTLEYPVNDVAEAALRWLADNTDSSLIPPMRVVEGLTVRRILS